MNTAAVNAGFFGGSLDQHFDNQLSDHMDDEDRKQRQARSVLDMIEEVESDHEYLDDALGEYDEERIKFMRELVALVKARKSGKEDAILEAANGVCDAIGTVAAMYGKELHEQGVTP